MAFTSARNSRHNDWRVIGYCLVVGLGICTFGLDNGETSGLLAMQAFLKDFGYFEPMLGAYNMTAQDETRMYGIELGLALIGGIFAGEVGSRYGRKLGLAFSAILCALGAGIQMISEVAGMLIGRGIMGFGVGFALVLAIAYWSEAAPAHMRGQIVIFYQIFINISAFVGALIDQGSHAMTSAMAYRIPLIVAVIVPCLLLVLIWIVPESPRWLVTRGRFGDARINLRKLRGGTYTEGELEQEIKEVIAFTAMELELEASTTFLDLFKGHDLRRTLIGFTLFSGQQLMGVGFLGGYLTYFFALSGFSNAFIIAVISNACAIAGSLSTILTIRLFGRRLLLICGAAVNAFCMLAFAIISVADSGSLAADRCLIAFICIFTFSYSATWGSVVPVVVGEVFSNRLRSKGVAFSMMGQWVFSMLVICGAPYLINTDYANIGTKIGFIFGGLTVPLVVFAYFCVPETKGRSLEEIDEMFMNGIASRKFKAYVCTGHAGNLDADQVYEAVHMKENVTMVERV